MHRSNGANTAHRANVGGGARTTIDKVDDGPLMQTMAGNAMKGETRKDVESPQNYGFTSVVADAKKGKDGQIEQSAEGFMSYMGGNKAFPVCGVMDDRRHRLKELAKDAAKGATAVFGQKEWGQQYLNTEDGQFITGNKEKKNRMQLVENQNGKKTSQAGGRSAQGADGARTLSAEDMQEVTPHTVSRNAAGRLAFRTASGVEFEIEEDDPEISTFADGAAAGGEQSQGAGKATGQKTLHKEETDIAVEQNGSETFSQHGKFYTAQRSGSDASSYYENRKKSAQATDNHVHVRYEDNRIWVDKEGHWSESPILQKKDKHCKE
jgi:phage gp45-like